MTPAQLYAHAAPSTSAAYLRDLHTIAAVLDEPGGVEGLVARIFRSRIDCAEVLRTYLERTPALSHATRRRRVAAVRALVRAASDAGLVTFDAPRLALPSPAVARFGLDVAGVRALLVAASRVLGLDEGARMVAAIRLGFDLGLRAGEVLGLDLADLDRSASVLLVTRKGGHVSRRSMPGPTLAALDAWIAARPLVAGGRVFVSLRGSTRGAPWAPRAYRSQFARVSRLALGRALSPHALRHAGVTAALDASGGDVRAVSRWAEHRDPRTTIGYDDDRRDLAGDVAQLVAASACVPARQLALSLVVEAQLVEAPLVVEAPARAPLDDERPVD